MHEQNAMARRTAVGVGIILALAATASCIKPAQEDDFFEGNGSSVTGDDDESDDDAPPEGMVDDDDQSDDDAEDDDEVPPESDDDDDDGKKTPVVDAGVKPTVDAASPRADAARAAGPDAALPRPEGDAGASGGPASDAGEGPSAGPAPTKLTFKVTTTTMRGRYSPKHVLAIWVTDAQGKFVKTLAKHAFIRGRYLTGWNSAASGNVVDAVTSATLNSHGTRTLTWNLTDVMKKPVPDGDYKIVMELTENDRTGVTATVPFTKGPTKAMVMPPDAPSFTAMSVVLE